jgi:LysM repeat protein
MKKKAQPKAAGGKLKMAKGGSVSVGEKGTAKTLSQIAKQNNTSIQALLAANPSIKNANTIRMGQKIKLPKAKSVPGNTKTKNPYARMSQTQMNMMASKDKNKQRTVTRAIRNEAKSGAQTSPTPKLAKATKEKKSGNQAMLDKAREKRAEDKAAGKKPGFLSKLFGKKSGGSMKKVTGYKSGGSCRGGGAATKGKRYGRSG